MTKFGAKIKELHRRKKALENLNMKVRGNRGVKDTQRFYEESLSLINVGKGIAVIISPNEEYREFTDLSFDDKKAARIMLHRVSGDTIDFNESNKDYRDVVTQDYKCVFISMKSILGDPTEIYVPSECSDYQLERIKLFNNEVKDFNNSHTPSSCVRLHYDGVNTFTHDLDGLIETIDPNSREYTTKK